MLVYVTIWCRVLSEFLTSLSCLLRLRRWLITPPPPHLLRDIIFKKSSLMISMFVFDILQIPSGCSASTSTPLVTGLRSWHIHWQV